MKIFTLLKRALGRREITLDLLAAEHADLLRGVLSMGYARGEAAGAAAERARIKSIEELPVEPDEQQIVAELKYNAELRAQDVALAIAKRRAAAAAAGPAGAEPIH